MMSRSKRSLCLLLAVVLPVCIYFLSFAGGRNSTSMAGDCTVMFYNVENLFDTEDDPSTNDNEFLPNGTYRWTNKRLQEKLHHLSEVIAQAGGWSAPAVVGLAEVENRKVLDMLLDEKPLARAGYDVVHFDSPDSRGIDVAMLYRREMMKVIRAYPIRIPFEDNPYRHTRDILHVEGLMGADTIHFFVNHWPSRSGGEAASDPLRQHVADVLRQAVDSVFRQNINANILIMGDFNDTPENESLKEVLQAKADEHQVAPGMLLNLACNLSKREKGSYKYRGDWDFLDQMIVSEALVHGRSGMSVAPDAMRVFAPAALLEEDKTYTGVKPFRMYVGPQYHGGYSDHLPVCLEMKRSQVR